MNEETKIECWNEEDTVNNLSWEEEREYNEFLDLIDTLNNYGVEYEVI